MKAGGDPAVALLRRAEHALAVRSSGLLFALVGMLALVWMLGTVPTALLLGLLALLVVD